MSYTRENESGFYIYPRCISDASYGVQFTHCNIEDKELNVFLYKLFATRPDELLQRINDGKKTIAMLKRNNDNQLSKKNTTICRHNWESTGYVAIGDSEKRWLRCIKCGEARLSK